MCAAPVVPAASPAVPAGSRVVIVVSQGAAPVEPHSYVAVPDVVGKPQGEALGALQDVGMPAQVFNDYSDTLKRGVVSAQLPSRGMSVPGGTDAVLLVSSGPAPSATARILLPEVAGSTEAAAVDTIQSAGLSPQVVRAYSRSVPDGTVISQLPNRVSLAEAPPKGVNWMLIAGIGAALVAAGLALVFFFGGGAQVTVPDVAGLELAEAQAALDEAGLTTGALEATETADAPEGTVVAQDPPAGVEAREGSAVALVVSGGVPLVDVPDVEKLNQADATKELEDAGLEVSVARAPDAFVDKGLVSKQSPQAGTKVEEGTTVEITISEGAAVENVRVPDVTGLTRSGAEKALEDAGLKVVVAESSSDAVAADVVISQLPEAGASVAPGTQVGILVSTGAPPAETVSVPNVVGLTLAAAQQTISDAGLVAVPVPSAGTGKPANEVVAQSPEAGTEVTDGGSVVLFYSSGP